MTATESFCRFLITMYAVFGFGWFTIRCSSAYFDRELNLVNFLCAVIWCWLLFPLDMFTCWLSE